MASSMAVVYYKYKSSKDTYSLAIDGPYISVSEFKALIFTTQRYGTARDFDLLISNAETDEQYTDDSFLIMGNASLLIRRIPVPSLPIVIREGKLKKDENPSSVAKGSQEEGGIDFHDFGPNEDSIIKSSTSNPSNTHCKKLKNDDGFKVLSGFGKVRVPPQGYVCNRCKVAGHYIQHCPTNGDPSYDIRRVKPAIEDSRKASASTSGSSCGENMIPPELHCPLCKKVLKDAALTKCCFSSFCEKCIRDHIVSNSACVCQRKIAAADVVPNMTLRDTVDRVMKQSASRSSGNGGTSCSIQDYQKTEEVKEPTSKGRVLAAAKEEKQTRKRKVCTMMPNYLYSGHTYSGFMSRNHKKMRV